MWVKIVVIGYASAVALANVGLVAWAWRWGQITLVWLSGRMRRSGFQDKLSCGRRGRERAWTARTPARGQECRG